MAPVIEPEMMAIQGSLYFSVRDDQSIFLERKNVETDMIVESHDLFSELSNHEARIAAASASIETTASLLSSLIANVTNDYVTETSLVNQLDAVNNNIDAAEGSARDYASQLVSTLRSETEAAVDSAVASLESSISSGLAAKADNDAVFEAIESLIENIAEVEEDVEALVEATEGHSGALSKILECMEMGFVHDPSTDECVPAFRHDDCMLSIPKHVTDCESSRFGEVCTFTCVTGYRGGGEFSCGADSQWDAIGDASFCEEIDECDEGTDECEGMCHNTDGGYTCSCPGSALIDDHNCAKLDMVFLTSTFNIRLAASSHCSRGALTVSQVPTSAVAIVGTVTTHNTCGNDHVTYSLGRDYNHDCFTWDNRPYDLNTYLNDFLITQNGDAAYQQPYGHSSGMRIIPLGANRQLQYSLAMGQSRCTNRILVQVYGYLTGQGILPTNQIRNQRWANGGGYPRFNAGRPSYIPDTASGLLMNINTFVSSRDDHYSITLGRDNGSGQTWENEPYNAGGDPYYGDVKLTINGDSDTSLAYYGYSFGTQLVPTLSNGDYKIINGEGGNGPTKYLTNQIIGYIPGGGFSNIKWFATNEVKRMRFVEGGVKRLTSISPPSNVPSGAKAIMALIYTFQDRAFLDHVVHTFGRSSSHITNPWGATPYDHNGYINDVLITHQGQDAGTFHYGYWHGLHAIPLKSDGKFEAYLNLGNSSGHNQYITIFVIGYIA